MKLKKLFALALCFAMCVSCLAAFGSVSAVEIPDNGLNLSKSVSADANGNATIKLEAFATGDVSQEDESVPADIVLVLEETSKMGEELYDYVPIYKNDPTWNPDATYYIQNADGSYSQVHDCDRGVCGLYENWVTGFHLIFFHWGGTQYNPMEYEGQKDWSIGNYTHHYELFYTRIKHPQYDSRLAAVKEFASDFVEDVYKKATEDPSNPVDHKVSVVGFSNEVTTQLGLTDVSTSAGMNTVLRAINDLGANGTSANVKAGLDEAVYEFAVADAAADASSEDEKEVRNRVVVVYTYGAPNDWNWTTANTMTAASSAIGSSYTLKNTYKATVYAVGMSDDVDPTMNIMDSELSAQDKTTSAYLTNTFLHYLSSNFPIAEDMTTPGTNYKLNGGYYIQGTDADSLEGLFDDIFTIITKNVEKPDITLDRTTVIRDTVSQYFTITGVTVHTENYAGKGSWTDNNDSVSLSHSGQTVTYSGFDFSENFVDLDGKSGSKVVLEISVSPIDKFLGGNGVPVHVADMSYVSYKGATVEEFPEPDAVAVPINYNVTKTQDVTVYRGNQVGVTDLYTIPAVGGIYNDFVTVEYMVNGQTVSVGPEDVLDTKWFNALSSDGCADFPLTGTVKPVNAGPVANASITPETAKVHVLNPILDGTDVTIWQGNNTKLAATTDWKCTCVETFKTPADATEGLAALDATTPVFTEKGKTDAVITASPADCTQYTVAFTANNIPYTNDFWVHVLTASITVDDTKIYLSESVTVDDVKKLDHYSWETSCGHDNVPEMTETEKNAQKTPEPSFATVTPTNCGEHKAYLKIGTITYTTSDTFTIHVLKPTVETLGTTIFLGDDARLTGSVDSWACDRQVCENIQSGSKNADIEDDITWEFVKVDDNKVTTDKVTDEKLTKCTPTVAVGTLYGQKFTSKTVMVHVVLPTVTGTEATIKMGNPAPLAATTEWDADCACDEEKQPKNKPEYPLSSKFYDTDGKTVVTNYGVLDGNPSYPSSCHTYIAAAIVNGVEYTFDGNRDDFMIHVQTPVVTGTDTAIYLGNDTTLAAEITDWNACKPAEGEENGTHGQGLTNSNEANPEHSFIYTDNETNTQVTTVSPVTCKPYTVGLKTIGGVTLAGTEYPDEFTVHVHVPQFTVTAQDLWADYNASVHLYNDTDSDAVVSIAQIWVDRRGDDSTLIATGNDVVDITDLVFHKIDDTVMTNPYTMVDSDVDVNIIKITADVNGEDYAAVKADSTEDTDKQLSVTKAKSEEDHDFTVHVNKFKAVITNNGTQNAIYTLSNGTKVAVEAGKSTTVAGLICGKDYEISEANNDWTWRYGEAASAKDADRNEKKYISCKVNEVKASATPESSDSVFMTYGSITNPKWLADEDCVVNNAATPNCTIPVKKEDDEEVTNV